MHVQFLSFECFLNLSVGTAKNRRSYISDHMALRASYFSLPLLACANSCQALHGSFLIPIHTLPVSKRRDHLPSPPPLSFISKNRAFLTCGHRYYANTPPDLSCVKYHLNPGPRSRTKNSFLFYFFFPSGKTPPPLPRPPCASGYWPFAVESIESSHWDILIPGGKNFPNKYKEEKRKSPAEIPMLMFLANYVRTAKCLLSLKQHTRNPAASWIGVSIDLHTVSDMFALPTPQRRLLVGAHS